MTPPSPPQALAALLHAAGLPDLGHQADLVGTDPVLASSFAIGTAAQAGLAAAALAACQVGQMRGQDAQRVAVDMRHAALECTSWFSINGHVPALWDAFSGLYRCADGWVRLHANFAHHREGALRLLGLQPGQASRADAQAALMHWSAQDFEDAAARAGLVASALRRFDEWDAHPQGMAVAAQPLLRIERIGDAPARRWPEPGPGDGPLAGLRMLDLTRILAGPVACRLLAGLGADVMMVNAPHLPNIDAIADLSRGKRSALLDLRDSADAQRMRALLAGADVMVQGYRPGALQALGFGPQETARLSPGIVHASLSAYGAQGPWSGRRGFDSLVQTAMGFNHAEAQAMGADTPRALPVQMLDHGAGHLLVLGVCAALLRQRSEGGSWHVQVSLARTGQWIRSLGRVDGALAPPPPKPQSHAECSPTGWGEVCGIRPAVRLSRTPLRFARAAHPPGHDAPAW